MKPLIAPITMIVLMFLITGCGSNNTNNATTVYAAHVVNMEVSVGTGTTSTEPALAPALKSEVASTTSIQNFYSGDIKWTTARMEISVQIQNDSNVPINPMLMTYWDPANYPYPSDWPIDQHGLITWCGGAGVALQPGETVTIPLNFALGSGALQYTGLLGPQEISLWVYAKPTDWNNECQPDFWNGTIQNMQDYVSTHPALAIATSHYNLVVPSYTDNGNGTIIDNVTGLVWQKQDDGTKRTWDDAISYCSSLSLAGAGWRLPTVTELMTIIDTGYLHPSLDTTYFPNTQSDVYWSSTIVPDTTWVRTMCISTSAPRIMVKAVVLI